MDLLLIFLVFIIVILILCGFISLLERNVLALVQMRIGPAIFFFGLLSPIFDGLNLFINFSLMIINVDYLYFFVNILLGSFCLYILWFIFPVGYLTIIDYSFSVIFILCLHSISNVSCIYVVGIMLFYTSYSYMATISYLFFSIIAESCLSLFLLICFVTEYSTFFSIKLLSIHQLFISNFFYFNVWLFFIFIVVTYLDNMRLPFDYLECESELVAGLITEFSGIFFCIYSLMELNHVILSSFMIVLIFFGGLFICFNSIFILVFFFIVPSSLLCSLRITNAYSFFILYIYFLLFIYLIWYLCNKFFFFYIF